MSNKIKAVIILAVLAVIVFATIIILLNAGTRKYLYQAFSIEVNDEVSIEVGDEVYVVNTSIDESTIIEGTVIEIKYQDNEIVEYAVLLPQVVNSVAIYSVVIYSPVNIFLTHKQALKYALNN